LGTTTGWALRAPEGQIAHGHLNLITVLRPFLLRGLLHHSRLCASAGSDVRMTTRFKVDEPLDSLFASIHETGHGLYEQGLPAAQAGTALGQHAGMAVHESQSRLWENQVARSRGFWRNVEPRLRALFPTQTAGLTGEELYLAVNLVEPTLVRVEADEVTYNLHIILRFEMEKKLFSGELAVRDLPAAWRAASREIVGLEPATDRAGVLQDVHWSDGAFGYFPSYCLGNLLAAQLWYRALTLRPGLEEEFARGDFSWLLAWLRAGGLRSRQSGTCVLRCAARTRPRRRRTCPGRAPSPSRTANPPRTS